MSKYVKKLTNLFRIEYLFELDSNGDAMPIEDLPAQFDTDINNDIMPFEAWEIEDEEFELDTNYDIMPKE